MRQPRTKKTFDCVEMKRKGAARIYETIKGMTPEQEKAYWQQVDEAFQKRQEERERNALTPGCRNAPRLP